MVILNNFDFSVRFAKLHRFPSKEDPKLAKVYHFLQSGRISPTLKAPGRKTVHPSKSVTETKVVQNNISDNFYFDLNIVRPKLN